MSKAVRTLTTIAVVIVVPAAFTVGLGSATAVPLGHAFGSRTLVVNTTADTVDADVGSPKCADLHGMCSLRAAITQANFDKGPDTIKVPAGTYRLTRKGGDDQDVLGDLDITNSLRLRGAGSAKVIIDGNGKVTGDRVLQILATARDVAITGVTIRGGTSSGRGGGLNWAGKNGNELVLTHVVVARNRATYGGGVALDFSDDADTATLTDVTAQNNTATGFVGGGGLWVRVGTAGTFLLRKSLVRANKAYEGAGVVLTTYSPYSSVNAKSIQIRRSVIASNRALTQSGGLENFVGYGLDAGVKPVRVVDSDIHDNYAGLQGGGIGNLGSLHLDSSTVEGNSSRLGGALYDYDGAHATLTNDTLAGNSAITKGGAVYVEYLTHPASVAFRSSTLSGNSAPTDGGVFVDSPGSNASFANTVIAKGATGRNCSESFGGLTNLSDDSWCGFGAGDSVASLGLGRIGAHGGFTRTLVPKVGSPALDTGTATGAPATDQRGITRPKGAEADIGAVEVCPLAPGVPARVAPIGAVEGPRVTLVWKEVGCIQTYSVVIRAKSTTGKVAQSQRGLLTSTFRTKKLAKSKTYFWRVSAIGDRGTTASGWHRVRVKSR